MGFLFDSLVDAHTPVRARPRVRDALAIAKAISDLHPSIPTLVNPPLSARSVFTPSETIDLAAIEDRRQWSPAGDLAPAVSFSKPRHRLESRAGSAIGFQDAAGVLVCVRRRSRREVLLAKGHGGGGNRPPRRGPYSDIIC